MTNNQEQSLSAIKGITRCRVIPQTKLNGFNYILQNNWKLAEIFPFISEVTGSTPKPNLGVTGNRNLTPDFKSKTEFMFSSGESVK